jgi:hypothetical protein
MQTAFQSGDSGMRGATAVEAASLLNTGNGAFLASGAGLFSSCSEFVTQHFAPQTGYGMEHPHALTQSVQRLRHGVHLVIMTAMGERCGFLHERFHPRRCGRVR